MDASPIFNSLLRSIEESQLNYSMSRTAFSATISIKCSFLKRFAEASTTGRTQNLPSSKFQLDKNAKQLEDENLKLQIEIKALKNTDIDQKKGIEELVRVQQVYELEKEKSKAFEIKIAEFREEVLKLKNEKHELSKNFKTKNSELEAMKAVTESHKKENNSLRELIKDKTKVLEMKKEKLQRVKTETESVKKSNIELKEELDSYKLN